MEGARNWAVQLLQGPQEAGSRAASQESSRNTSGEHVTEIVDNTGFSWATYSELGGHPFVQLNNATLLSLFEMNKTG